MKLTIPISPMMRAQLYHAQNIEIEIPEVAELESKCNVLKEALKLYESYWEHRLGVVGTLSNMETMLRDSGRSAIAEAERGIA
ncbi:TPA: hypothetical protein ACNV64_001318 [Aeromonas salmonicida subsp. pectinolytica]